MSQISSMSLCLLYLPSPKCPQCPPCEQSHSQSGNNAIVLENLANKLILLTDPLVGGILNNDVYICTRSKALEKIGWMFIYDMGQLNRDH